MTGQPTLTQMALYLQQRARNEPEISHLLRQVFLGHGVANLGELSERQPDAIEILYDAVQDMEVDIQAMESSDAAVDESWRRQRARQAEQASG